MLIFTIQFFLGMFFFGLILALIDEYIFKNRHGLKFRLFQASLFSFMMTCLVPLNIWIVSSIG